MKYFYSFEIASLTEVHHRIPLQLRTNKSPFLLSYLNNASHNYAITIMSFCNTHVHDTIRLFTLSGFVNEPYTGGTTVRYLEE